MNNPEYSVIAELKKVADNIKTVLNIPVLNFLHGYLEELNETLMQYSRTPEFAEQKYPLLWVVEPFTVTLGPVGFYAHVDNLKIFILYGTDKNLKGYQRREQIFVPIIDPIRRELLRQLTDYTTSMLYEPEGVKITDRYYWGEEQQKQLNDVVDCTELNNLRLKIYHNTNCL